MQHIGAAGEAQAEVVDEEARVGGAVRGQIVLEHFDPIFVLAAGAVEIAVQALGSGSVKGGDDDAGIVAEGHDLGFEDDAEGWRPGLGGVVEVVIGAGDGRGRLVMAPGVVTTDLMLSVGGVQEGLHQGFEDGVAAEAEDKIGLRSARTSCINSEGRKARRRAGYGGCRATRRAGAATPA